MGANRLPVRGVACCVGSSIIKNAFPKKKEAVATGMPGAEPGSQKYSAQVQGHSAASRSNGRRVQPPTPSDPGTQKELKELQQQLRAGGVHSLSEPLQEKEQNQDPEEKWCTFGLTKTGTWALQPAPEWPTQVKGFQHEVTKVSVASAVLSQAFSFEDAVVKQLPACANEGSFVFQQTVPAAVPLAPSSSTHKDGFVLKQVVPEAMAPVSGSSNKPDSERNRQVSVDKAAAVLEVRVELADTPPKAPLRLRSKRQVSPGLNTPQAPAAKREMVEGSEEEEKDDGTDEDIRRWMEAEHMEIEQPGGKCTAQEGTRLAQGNQAQLDEDGDEEEEGRELTRRRVELMGSEVTEGEEAARARRGPLFTDENFTMGG